MFEIDGVNDGIAREALRLAAMKLPVKTRIVAREELVIRIKPMNVLELREKTPDELDEQLALLKKELFNLRFQKASGQSESTARMRTARRDVARVKTIVNEKKTNEKKLGEKAKNRQRYHGGEVRKRKDYAKTNPARNRHG